MRYDPMNWYWADDAGRVYSSASESFVKEDDATYKAWLDGGNYSTPWPRDEKGEQTNEALLAVVSAYGLSVASSALDAARQKRSAALSLTCAEKIIGGFTSSALGSEHHYPSEIKDQINLMGSVTDSIMPGLPSGWKTPFWCRDSDGAWSYKMHDASQIQQAGRDGKAHVVNCQTTLETLNGKIASAKTVAAVNAISWPE